MFKHVLIATDGSEVALKAVEKGLELAKSLGAKVTAITVTEPWTAIVSGEMGIAFPIDDYDKSCAESAATVLADVAGRASKADVPCVTHHVKDQFAAEGIVEAAAEFGCDVIVMASHGRRGLSRVLLGSQTNKVLVLSKVPVLVWR